MWEFRLPTEIVFGEGAAGGVAERIRLLGQRCLAVCDRIVAETPAAARALAGIESVGRFQDVDPNPTVANVNALTAMARALEADVIVAIGGGSAIDCAKAAAAVAPGDGDSIEPYHTGGAKLETTPLPLVAMPTTAGTGSEVTPVAVLDDRAQGVKAPLAGPMLYPALAVVDPLLTHSMPKFLTACTGMDALSHAMEGYWSIHHQPICDAFAMEAARLVFQKLETACREPENAEARRAMSYAALLAGMAFQLPKNAMVHACSYPLSNRFHLPHGAACAFTLEFAIKLNAPAMAGRMETFAKQCGFETVDAMCNAVHRLKEMGGLPCTLADAAIPEDAVDVLVKESFHPLMNNNPATVTEDDLRRMYRELAQTTT
jgi:alcohol dehydrogenase